MLIAGYKPLSFGTEWFTTVAKPPPAGVTLVPVLEPSGLPRLQNAEMLAEADPVGFGTEWFTTVAKRTGSILNGSRSFATA